MTKEEAAKLYSEKKITLAKAAKEASVSIWEMIDYLRRKEIATQYDLDEFRKDVETVLRRTGSDRSGTK